MRTKKKFRFWIITRNISLIIVAALVILFVLDKVMTANEQNKYPAIGQLVEVDGKNMHVYSKGDGENTIVLLGGLGTAAPALDFEPLINEMAKNNKIVVVELFGYGWSDISDKRRTVENIVEEIRTALQSANIEGPYILMPHSISGIYSMYYANEYSDEVKAVIAIDPTLPGFNHSPHTKPNVTDSQAMPQFHLAPTGIARLAFLLAPDVFFSSAEEGIYSEENIKMTKAISVWNSFNKNVANETDNIHHNIDKTIDMEFPPEMPVMIFTPKVDNMDEDGQSKITFYKTLLSNSTSNELVTLEGSHYLHGTRYIEMSEFVNEFIETHVSD